MFYSYSFITIVVSITLALKSRGLSGFSVVLRDTKIALESLCTAMLYTIIVLMNRCSVYINLPLCNSRFTARRFVSARQIRRSLPFYPDLALFQIANHVQSTPGADSRTRPAGPELSTWFPT